MLLEKKECVHIIELLEKIKIALLNKDAVQLKELSNQTVHSSCHYQDSASITISVIIYALGKLVEREDYNKVKNWDAFTKKFNSILSLAIKAVNDDSQEKYEDYIKMARTSLESNAINLKKYIQEVLKKAAINKGSRIYEHGLSIEHTAKLLGITQWELSEYVGQKPLNHEQVHTIDIKKRAKIALEFFS